MKIKFDTDDDLRLKKPLKLSTITIVVRYDFEENGKFYQQIYLDECFKCYNTKNWRFRSNWY